MLHNSSNHFMKLINLKTFLSLSVLLLLSFDSSAQKDASDNSLEFIVNGINLHDQEKYQGAIEAYEKVCVNDTNYALAVYEKTLSYINLEEYEKAVETAKEGLSLFNKDYEALFYTNYGTALSNLDKYEESSAIYTEGIKKYPFNSSLRYNHAVVLLKAKKYDEALNILYKNTTDNPFHSKSHLLLALIAQQNENPSKAMLAYSMYLLMEDNTATNYSIIKAVDGYANSRFEGEGDYTDVPLKNEGYETIDELVVNKVAINKKYKTSSKFSYPMVKQLDLIMKTLSSLDLDEDDFWTTFYMPFFAKISDEGQFSGFITYVLRAGEEYNTDIAKTLKKEKSDRAQFLNWFGRNFTDMYAMHEVDGKTVEYHYEDSDLIAIGEYDYSNQTKSGKWTYYYSNGGIRSEGIFKDNKKDGVWKYYSKNGQLSSSYTVKNGVTEGPFEIYNDYGVKIKDGNFEDDLFEGVIKAYFSTGGIDEEETYKTGVLDGPLTYYHENGQKSLETTLDEGKIEGNITRYNAFGIKTAYTEYTADVSNGKNQLWHANGQLKLDETYEDGKRVGESIRYYNDGSISKKSNYVKGKLVGESNDYFKDGTVSSLTTYDSDGKQHGDYIEFFTDGRVYSKMNYKNGDLDGFVFYGQDGEITAEGKKKGNTIDFVRLDSNGYKNLEGKFVKGIRDGKWIATGPQGIVYKHLNYEDTKQSGKQTFFHNHGEISQTFNMVDDNIEGPLKSYEYGDPNIVSYEGYYIADERQGLFISRNSENHITEKNYYVDGKLDGWNITYSADGQLDQKSYYEEGLLLGIHKYDTAGNVSEHWLENGTGTIEYTYPDGTKSFVGTYKNGKANESFKWYYPDGSLETSGNYVNGTRSGEWSYYYLNGQLTSKLNYMGGNRVGPYTSYYDNGKKNIVCTYVNGEIEGEYTKYFRNGNLKEKSDYINGDIHGWRVNYAPTGQIASRRKYVDDVIVAYQSPKSDGSYTELIPVDGSETEVTCKFPNGNTSLSFTMAKGVYDGDFKWFYPNGQLYSKRSYDKHVIEGEVINYFSDGTISSKYQYNNDELHGLCIDYYTNGKMKRQRNFYAGDLEGVTTNYDKNGNVTSRYLYFTDDIYTKLP